MTDSIVISGIGLISPTSQELRTVETATGPVSVALLKAPDPVLPVEIPESIQRRMPRISRMCLATAIDAVETGLGRDVISAAPERVGVIVGTAYGCLEIANLFEKRLILEGPAGASPSLFATSVHNSIASHLSITFGIQGPVCTINTMEDTTIGSFQLACSWLNQGTVDHVLVTIGDEVTEFQAYEAAHREDQILPLGEGAISFILSKRSSAKNIIAPWDETSLTSGAYQTICGSLIVGNAFNVAILNGLV